MKRNAEMVAALHIQSKVGTLSAATKHQRTKTHKASKMKSPTTEKPIITRESLRPRGMQQDSPDNLLKPISMIDAYRGLESEYNQMLIDTIFSIAEETESEFSDEEESDGVKDIKDVNFSEKETLESPVKADNVKEDSDEHLGGLVKIEKSDPLLESLDFEPETVASMSPGRIMVVKFFPSSSTTMIAAGNKFGDIAVWNVDCGDETEDSEYVYRPQAGPISGILIQQHSMSKRRKYLIWCILVMMLYITFLNSLILLQACISPMVVAD